MKKLAGVLLPLFASVSVSAQSAGGGLGGDRPLNRFLVRASDLKPVAITDHAAMTCADLRSAVDRYRKVKLTFKVRDLTTYTLIRSRNALDCSSMRDIQTFWTATSDVPQCWIGYLCD